MLPLPHFHCILTPQPTTIITSNVFCLTINNMKIVSSHNTFTACMFHDCTMCTVFVNKAVPLINSEVLLITCQHCQNVPAAGNFATFSPFLATYSTLDFTRSSLAGTGTWHLLPTTPSMLPTATKHFDRAGMYSISS